MSTQDRMTSAMLDELTGRNFADFGLLLKEARRARAEAADLTARLSEAEQAKEELAGALRDVWESDCASNCLRWDGEEMHGASCMRARAALAKWGGP